MIQESYAKIDSTKIKTDYIVQCSTVPDNSTITANMQKLIACQATTVSGEFGWPYHTDFGLKQKISLFEKEKKTTTTCKLL